eukprot:TRINITY_DN26426_c0_g1_i2.p1 TRINITY_DN26426_c0_g1~~TRINITY_DN26426_c0_g1_i2.p1  ORF type:complete len:282 (-),score=50.97 TRINITY_DN26426_c0_g1_i2:83-928(-)
MFRLFVLLLALVCVTGQPTQAATKDALFFAYAAYCKVPVLKSWTCEWCKDLPNFEIAQVVQNATTEAQFFAGYDKTNNRVLLSVRGTHNFKNILEDLKIKKDPQQFPGAPSDVKIEAGFVQVYNSIAADMSNVLFNLYKKHPFAPLFVTGHSLGAAVAEITAVDMTIGGLNWAWLKRKAIKPSMINFGCPRVGNKAYSDWFQTKLGLDKVRVVNKRDIIPHVPFEAWGFHHTPTELWYNTTGGIEWCTSGDGEDSYCSDSLDYYSLSDHLHYLGYYENGCP